MNENVNLMEENAIQINGGIIINVAVSVKKVVYVKNYVWNPAKYSCENGRFLASIMDDSAIMCDEVIESYAKETKTVPTNFNEQKTCRTKNFYILLEFLLNTIALLIAVRCHDTNNKLRKVY